MRTRVLRRHCGLSLALALAICLPLGGVESAPADTRSVLVSVADPAGDPVAGLTAEQLALDNAGVPCSIVRVSPAAYPLAIIVDTSSFARTDFRSLQSAAVRLATELPPRQIAVYSSGEPATRLRDFTADQAKVADTMRRAVAAPTGAPQTIGAILRVAHDLARLNEPVTGIIILSSSGPEMSPPGSQEVFDALRASRSILTIIEERTSRDLPSTAQQNAVLEALAVRAHGKYVRGIGAAVFEAGVEETLRQLRAHVVVEYAVSPDAPRALQLHVQPPNLVTLAIPLDR